MKTETAAMFELGQVAGTRPALKAISDDPKASLMELLDRHQACDWGDVGEADANANNDALTCGARIMSVYTLPRTKTKVWIITEGEDDFGRRQNTTVLLPSEY